ncbi:toll/interleukin-1 receptor domain-containing protein [Aquimonas sp.]|jgi:hypothetical protein|uniref:toll/interleukin-1 receptor domain-containing protein n=1 Tax=Aquimonas sp. TaxID=1872588 RepID=UPI0037BFBA43
MSLEEKEWRALLREIANRNVVPIIGARAVTVPVAGVDRPLYEHFAPQVAAGLNLPDSASYTSTAQLARDFIANQGARKNLRNELSDLLDQHPEPGAALTALASIEDFELYVSSTPDGLLAKALQRARRFDPDVQRFEFTPTGETRGGAQRCDIPRDGKAPLLFQILGSIRSNEVALWEEDYMEYIYALIAHPQLTEVLRAKLQKSSLLLIGAPSEDWIVRFMMRIARGKRLSDEDSGSHYFADGKAHFSEAMTFFFERATRATRIIHIEPVAFARELARRWRERNAEAKAVDVEAYFTRQSDRLPKDTVFISYAKEDRVTVAELGAALERAGVPVWVDKRQLEQGENYERGLRVAVMDCSFFISLISPRTEVDDERYFHKERRWAEDRFTEGAVFYLPLLLDMPAGAQVRREPAAFHTIERERYSAATLSGFVARVKAYWDEFRNGQRPRR